MNFVKRLSIADHDRRKNELMQILQEEEIPFTIQKKELKNYIVENIVVSIKPSSNRLVIGAHYDSVEGSTGANDNAAGVSILIKLTKQILLNRGDLSVDIVFFDREEEHDDNGSEVYILKTGKDNIKAMINLDICGYGDTIAISDKGNSKNEAYRNVFDDKLLLKHSVRLMKFLPTGDDTIFSNYGIPNISVCVLPQSDVELFEEFAQSMNADGVMPSNIKSRLSELDVIKTMHNGMKDYVDIVSQSSMDLLYYFLLEGLL